MPYIPQQTDSAIPQQQTQTLDCFRCRPVFFLFFHGHQQTNQDGARCLSTAWGRTSSCEFPWPKSDSEWLRAAGKITGEVTKWCWERLEAERRQKHETKRWRAKVLYGALKLILWYSNSSQRGKRWDHVVTSAWQLLNVHSQKAGLELFIQIRQHLLL